MQFCFEPIAIAHTCYPEKFGVPRQPGLVAQAWGELRMRPPFNQYDAVKELEHCSHIWVQFVFHQNKHSKWRPKVRPPRLGGNQSVGVFATRSPYRPNPIGLSVVELLSIEHNKDEVTLRIQGVDILDKTPVLDIKPYVPYSDRVQNAKNSLASSEPERIPVHIAPQVSKNILAHTKVLIQSTLAQDPRPGFHTFDARKIYAANIDGVEVKWRYVKTKDQLSIEVLTCQVAVV